MLAAFKTYLESHLAAADEAVKSDVRKVWAKVESWVTGEEAKVKAEIADLEARGYTVAKAAVAAATEPAAAPPAA